MRISHHAVDHTWNLLTQSMPTKKVLVANGVVQPGYEERVQGLLHGYGMELMPFHRIGKVVYLEPLPKNITKDFVRVEPNKVSIVDIVADETKPLDDVEALQDSIPFKMAA